MALVFTVGSGGIPAGVYPDCQFVGAEEFQSDNSEYGPGVRLKWKVMSGDQAGNETN